MNHNIKIKFLKDCPEHIPYLAQLWFEEISQHWIPNASVEQANDLLLQHTNIHELPIAFVALIDDEPVGMAALRENKHTRPDCALRLNSLVVSSAYRQQGIGEQLINAVKQKAKFLHYHTLYLITFDSTISAWHSRLGWHFVDNDQLFRHPVTLMGIAL